MSDVVSNRPEAQLARALRAVEDLRAELDAQRAVLLHLQESWPGAAPPAASGVIDAWPAVSAVPAGPPPGPVTDASAPARTRAGAVTGRRELMARVGLGGAGLVAAGAVAAVGTAPPAAADDTDPIIIGGGNVAATQTRLHVNGTTAIYGLGVDDNNMTQTMDVEPAIVGHAKGQNFNAGLYGRAEAGAIGVYASSVDYAAVVGTSTTSRGGTFQGGQSALRLTSTKAATPPVRSDAHQIGELEPDQAGSLWWCTAGGTPGKWRKVAGPDTAGSLHVLPTTTRVYDSRPGAVPTGGVKGRLGPGDERVIDATANGSGVPAGAVAVMVNLTVTNTGSGGFCALFPNGTTWPNTSSINWGLVDTSIANTTLVAVDASARFRVRCQGEADVVIDVIGYYR